MSMPQHFLVVLICEQYERGGELAAASAALIQREWGGIRPYIVGAGTHYRVRPAVSLACAQRGAAAGNAVNPSFLDPRHIDLWIGLDESSVAIAQSIVKFRGPAPGGFYRHVFPEPVVEFGRSLPNPPEDETQLDAWLDALTEKLEPWRERIWYAFGDSS